MKRSQDNLHFWIIIAMVLLFCFCSCTSDSRRVKLQSIVTNSNGVRDMLVTDADTMYHQGDTLMYRVSQTAMPSPYVIVETAK
jgi:hypothetical protein